VEKQMEDVDKKVAQIDKSSEQNVTEKNGLRNKILGIDKSLREIYSVIIARVEERRRGQAQDQVARKEAISKSRLDENEKVRRQQWAPVAAKEKEKSKNEGYLSKAPKPVRERLTKTVAAEEEQRTKFLHDIENWSQKKEEKPAPPPPPLPPAPHK